MIKSHNNLKGKIGLLVSVRDNIEAHSIRESNFDVLDIKNPDKGSLGRPAPSSVRTILAEQNNNAIVSVALGELHELHSGLIRDYFAECGQSTNLRFAKIGLSEMSNVDDWIPRWHQCINAFPDSVAPVAVAYLDDLAANSPKTENIIEAGQKIGCPILLLDTFQKNNGDFLNHVSIDDICFCRDLAKQKEMQLVLAGSVSMSSLDAVCAIQPDVVGVRGAVCELGNRRSTLSAKRVYEFTLALDKIGNQFSSTKKT